MDSNNRLTEQNFLRPELIKRLTRPMVQPGVINLQMGRRIIARSQAFLNRFPLLTQQMQRWSGIVELGSEQTPIVYVQPLSEEQNIESVSEAAPNEYRAATPKENRNLYNTNPNNNKQLPIIEVKIVNSGQPINNISSPSFTPPITNSNASNLSIQRKLDKASTSSLNALNEESKTGNREQLQPIQVESTPNLAIIETTNNNNYELPPVVEAHAIISDSIAPQELPLSASSEQSLAQPNSNTNIQININTTSISSQNTPTISENTTSVQTREITENVEYPPLKVVRAQPIDSATFPTQEINLSKTSTTASETSAIPQSNLENQTIDSSAQLPSITSNNDSESSIQRKLDYSLASPQNSTLTLSDSPQKIAQSTEQTEKLVVEAQPIDSATFPTQEMILSQVKTSTTASKTSAIPQSNLENQTIDSSTQLPSITSNNDSESSIQRKLDYSLTSPQNSISTLSDSPINTVQNNSKNQKIVVQAQPIYSARFSSQEMTLSQNQNSITTSQELVNNQSNSRNDDIADNQSEKSTSYLTIKPIVYPDAYNRKLAESAIDPLAISLGQNRGSQPAINQLRIVEITPAQSPLQPEPLIFSQSTSSQADRSTYPQQTRNLQESYNSTTNNSLNSSNHQSSREIDAHSLNNQINSHNYVAKANPPPKIDLDALAEKVERKLMKRLVVESERRGKKRWH